MSQQENDANGQIRMENRAAADKLFLQDSRESFRRVYPG